MVSWPQSWALVEALPLVQIHHCCPHTSTDSAEGDPWARSSWDSSLKRGK